MYKKIEIKGNPLYISILYKWIGVIPNLISMPKNKGTKIKKNSLFSKYKIFVLILKRKFKKNQSVEPYNNVKLIKAYKINIELKKVLQYWKNNIFK